MSDYSRITGLASGMDTENMIKDLMKAESAKKVKVEKEKQYIEWEKEAYQDISKMLREYQNNNFDLLSPDTNFRSPTMFAQFTSSITSGGTDSTALSVTGNPNITDLTHTIDYITQLASEDLYESTAKLKTNITGTEAINTTSIATINADISAGNNTFVVKFDGVSKNIELTGGYREDTDANAQTDLLADIQSQLDEKFGAGKINVAINGSELEFTTPEGGHQTTLIESDSNILTNLGFTSGDSDYYQSTTTLENAFGVSGDIAMEINGVSDFGITSSDTIKSMIDKINDSDAGVTVDYSELSGKIEIRSNETGEVNKIDFGDTANSFLADHLNIDVDDSDGLDGYTAAQDAIFSIDGVATSRANNDFTIDGANYSLKETSATAIEVKLNPDTDGLIEKISDFVDKYNDIIKMVNEKLDEERYYDYKPLSDDEKEAMTDDEIELWEEKAKSGILGSSNELQNIANEMRTLIYEPIEGLDISLKDIGIESSSNYKDNGKLSIDKEQLRESINNNYGKVVELFTKTSDIDYDDTANRSQRKAEEGIAHRIYDVLQDNIRNTRDSNGNKGILIEKAGFPNEVSDFNSDINDRIEQYDDRIDELLDYLDDRESYYYQMFAQMEKAMTEMQTQSSWLSSQMG